MIKTKNSDPLIDSILSTIGDTPLVRLTQVFDDLHFDLFAKMEMLNPGGSVKDRTAVNLLKRGVESGELRPGDVVIESTSGNLGIGLAQACSLFGLRLICVVDPKTTDQNIRILKTYGAEIEYVREPDPITGEYLQARLNRVQDLLRRTRNSFWPNQYASPFNPEAHRQTMHEILTSLNGKVDYLFCATSTCGTMRGCAEYVRDHGFNTKIIGVDAVGSVIFGGPRAQRLIPGHGAAVRPELFQPNLAYKAIHVTDIECVIACRRLALKEAILAGGSSGAVISAVRKIKHSIPSNAVCAVIFPDRGERYLDTIYSDEWVQSHFGSIESLWEEAAQIEPRSAAAF